MKTNARTRHRLEDVLFLLDNSVHPREIATHLGCTHVALVRWLYRHNHHHIARIIAREAV